MISFRQADILESIKPSAMEIVINLHHEGSKGQFSFSVFKNHGGIDASKASAFVHDLLKKFAAKMNNIPEEQQSTPYYIFTTLDWEKTLDELVTYLKSTRGIGNLSVTKAEKSKPWQQNTDKNDVYKITLDVYENLIK